MEVFDWTADPENSESPGPDSGFALLGLVPDTRQAVAAPQEHVAPPPTSVAPQALTRRELRERENAAATSRPRAAEPVQSPSLPVAMVPGEPVRQRKGPKPPKAVRPVRAPRGGGRRRVGGSAPPRKPATRHPVSRPKDRSKKSLRRRILSNLMTFGAMAGAGLMMVATSVPANAFLPTSVDVPIMSAPSQTQVQSLKVDTAAAGLAVARDSYTATSLREQIFLRYGNRNWSYTNNPNGTIQWPFPIAVPISDGFGYRISPCYGCSTDHLGVDFTPGAGAIIQAIADGTVSAVIASHYGLGNHIIIDHHINGQLVQSVYAHMADGTMRLSVGQQVKVTDEVGQVGSTGQSTGAHLHLEIHVNGVPVDPFAWLKANAN